MTVTLLQRPASSQVMHSQKTTNKISNKKSFIIYFDIQEHVYFNYINTYGTYNNINNNNNKNNFKNSTVRNKTDHFQIAVIIHKSICTPVSTYKARSFVENQGDSVSGNIAMRYYRLWIYACNVVLLGSAVGFAAAVSHTLLFSGDPRRYLVPGIPRAYDPTALYAYLALVVQLGLVQLLGCIAARRLSTKLLNSYWLLLLALLFGDAVIGVAWIFRFEKLRTDLRPILRLRLQVDYSKESRFKEHWDQMQYEFLCCGVTGPLDFDFDWPQSCCPSKDIHFSWNQLVGIVNDTPLQNNNITSLPCQNPHSQGCEDQLIHWLKKTADLLFILGFCVISFTKLCFLGILHYEIREMIQKIKLLKEPLPTTVPCVQSFFSGQHPQLKSQQQHQVIEIPANNGNIARRTTLPIITTQATSGTMSLIKADDYKNSKHPMLTTSIQDAGTDSDTNSHSALILEESTFSTHHCTVAGHQKNYSNNNYEMCEFNR